MKAKQKKQWKRVQYHSGGDFDHYEEDSMGNPDALLQELDDMKYDYDMLQQQYDDLVDVVKKRDVTIDGMRQIVRNAERIEIENEKLTKKLVEYQRAGINPINNEMKRKMILEIHNIREQMTELEERNDKLRNSTKQLRVNNKKMKQEMKNMKDENESLTQQIKMHQDQDENKSAHKEKKRNCNKQRRDQDQNEEHAEKEQNQEVEEWKKKYAVLERQYKVAVIQRNEYKSQLYTLQDDHKEMEIRYNDLQTKYDELESECNKKKSDWRTWDAEDIVNWIVKLNPKRYSKYQEILSVNLVKEEIDGSCLSDMDKNDLHRLGINVFKDKRDLIDKLQKLTKTATNLALNDIHNEGKITPNV